VILSATYQYVFQLFILNLVIIQPFILHEDVHNQVIQLHTRNINHTTKQDSLTALPARHAYLFI